MQLPMGLGPYNNPLFSHYRLQLCKVQSLNLNAQFILVLVPFKEF